MRFLSLLTVAADPPPEDPKDQSSSASDRVWPLLDLRKAALESVVIVASILLAFGIDAWWEDRQEAADMRESLEVVRRDLVDTLTQLEEFETFSGETAQASLDAVRALTGPESVPAGNRAAVELDLTRSSARRTMRLPRGGYTDLLSTGNLQQIDNRVLRDRLVQFYESADRVQEIVEKNSSVFTDGLVKDVLMGSGLVVPALGFDPSLQSSERRNEILAERMGAGFPTRSARLWQIPEESPELDRLIAALVQNARGAVTAELYSRDTRTAAADLLERVDQHLAEP